MTQNAIRVSRIGVRRVTFDPSPPPPSCTWQGAADLPGAGRERRRWRFRLPDMTVMRVFVALSMLVAASMSEADTDDSSLFIVRGSAYRPMASP